MAERRKPQQTPGIASVSGPDNDDFTLPATMYYDAVFFIEKAKASNSKGLVRASERFNRAAIYAAFGFLEATLNQAAFGHASAHAEKLGQIERDVLEEKDTTLDDKGMLQRRSKYYPIESRLSFLTLFLSGKEIDRSSSLWQRFVAAKVIRDTWTHPRPPFDTWSLKTEDVELAIRTLRDVILHINDLSGLQPPLWLTSFENVVSAIESGEFQEP